MAGPFAPAVLAATMAKAAASTPGAGMRPATKKLWLLARWWARTRDVPVREPCGARGARADCVTGRLWATG